MPSQDVLDGLFEIERRAEAIVAEARAEADRSVSAAKERARLSVAAAVASAAAASASAREAAAAEAQKEYRHAVEAYRREIDSMSVDEAIFFAACERIVEGSV